LVPKEFKLMSPLPPKVMLAVMTLLSFPWKKKRKRG
jgi:hypothetical protein